MISFCTACCNRVDHIKTTYKRNLKVAKDHEFILVNYGDKEGLDDYVKSDLMEYDNLTYYKTDVKYFHMAKSKNLSHRLATGDFLFTLDADTYIGARVVDNALECLEGDYFLGPHWSKGMTLGLSSENFYKLGGFDERMEGWGTEDQDLRLRAQHLGLKYLQMFPQSFSVIDHGNDERVSSFDPRFRKIQNNNIDIYKEHEKNKTIKVNLNGFEKHEVIKNFKEGFIV